MSIAYIEITGDMLRPVTGHPGPAQSSLTCYCSGYVPVHVVPIQDFKPVCSKCCVYQYRTYNTYPNTTMANPRQRNKQRSGRQTKPSSNQKRRLQMKLKRAPPLKGPQVLSENWDRKKTVFQK